MGIFLWFYNIDKLCDETYYIIYNRYYEHVNTRFIKQRSYNTV